MVVVERSDADMIRFGLEIFIEDINVDVLLEVEVLDLAMFLLEALSPFRSVDELYPQFMKLRRLKADHSQ